MALLLSATVFVYNFDDICLISVLSANTLLHRRCICMQVRKGDIFFADLSPVVGSEQGGVRPVLVVQNDIGNRFSPTIIVAAVTSPSSASAFHGCLPPASALLRRRIVPSMVGVEKVMLSPLVARFVAGIPNFTRYSQ